MRTFNVAALCSEDYSVEPLALRFLVEHGFDFQKQYSLGVPYHRGSDQVSLLIIEFFNIVSEWTIKFQRFCLRWNLVAVGI